MTKLTYKDLGFKVDRRATHATYANVKSGSADGCECFDCRNYVLNRENAFPSEIRILFDQLGIDYRRENEVSRMFKHSDGLHVYWGFFHFKGQFEGQDSNVPIAATNQHSIIMTPITENFSIGFTYGRSLAYFEAEDELVQVDFEVKLPWVASKKEECDW
ncbi:MAG: hypothetical protein V4594_05265 [Bacteroidota bacterium]